MSTKPRKKLVTDRVNAPSRFRLRTLQTTSTTRRPFTFELPKLKSKSPAAEKANLDSSKKNSLSDSGTRNLRTTRSTKAAIEGDQDDPLQELHFSHQSAANKTLKDTGNKSRDSLKRKPASTSISKPAAKSPRKKIVAVPHQLRANKLRLQTLRKRTTKPPFVFELPQEKTRKPVSSPAQSVVPEHELQTPPESPIGENILPVSNTAAESPRLPIIAVPAPQPSGSTVEEDILYEIVDDAEYKANPLQMELKKLNMARTRAKNKKEKVTRIQGSPSKKAFSRENNLHLLHMWQGRDRCREPKDPCDLDVILDMIINVINNFKNNAEDEFAVQLCDTYRANLQKLITDELDKIIGIQKINNKISKVRRQLTARNKFRMAVEKENIRLQEDLETKLRERNDRATTTNAAD